jgi:hypothetical protein
MKNNRENLDDLLKKVEQSTERYIEAEEFIMNLNTFEKIFCSKKIKNFMKSRLIKYNI